MEFNDSSIELGTITMTVNIEELEEQENEVVNLVVKGLNTTKINLSDSDVSDIKVFYDKIFEYIVSEKTLIEFQLNDNKSNLFYEVASDIIDHLNSEIKQSEEKFKKIIELTNYKNFESAPKSETLQPR